MLTVADTTGAIETRSHFEGPWLVSDDEIVKAWISGEKVNVDPGLKDPRDAITISAFWRAVTLVGEIMGNLPKHIVRELDDDSFERVRRHPVGKIFREQSSPYVAASTWFETAVIHAFLYGISISEIEWTLGNQAIALHTMDPTKVSVKYGRDDRGRELYFYEYQGSRGPQRLHPQDVFVIKGPSFSDIESTSRVMLARRTLGIALLGEQIGGRFLNNGAVPSLVIETSALMQPQAEQQLDATLKARQGPNNAGKALVMPPGATAKAIGVDAQKAQLLETREHQVREVSRVTGVPAFLLGDMTAATYNNGESLGRQFVDYTLGTWGRRFEDEARIKLLSDNLRLKFNYDALLRADTLSRMQAYQIGRSISLYDINDLLALEDRPRLPGDEGKQRLYPLNHGIVGEDQPEPKPAPEAPPSPAAEPLEDETERRDLNRKVIKPHVQAFVARMTDRHAKALAAARSKLERTGDVREYADWASAYVGRTKEAIVEFLTPITESASALDTRKRKAYAVARSEAIGAELQEQLLSARTAHDVAGLIDEIKADSDRRVTKELRLLMEASDA
jgi:phage portal protein, HK97 family